MIEDILKSLTKEGLRIRVEDLSFTLHIEPGSSNERLLTEDSPASDPQKIPGEEKGLVEHENVEPGTKEESPSEPPSDPVEEVFDGDVLQEGVVEEDTDAQEDEDPSPEALADKTFEELFDL